MQMVLGIINSRDIAEETIDDLEQSGFNPKDISIVMQDTSEAKEIHKSTGADVTEGAVSGATTGGIIGGVAGLLVGVGAIAVPGIGALLIGGPLAAALGLTGATATTVSGAVTGALAGGIVGGLMNLGLSENDARVYEDSIKEGSILIAVPTKSSEQRDAKEILETHGASEIRTITVNS